MGSRLERRTRLRRTASLDRTGAPARRTRLPRRSERSRLREALWREAKMERRRLVGDRCEAAGLIPHDCAGHGEHGHHAMRRREGDDSADNCRWVCAAGHAAIHANAKLARKHGLIVSAL